MKNQTIFLTFLLSFTLLNSTIFAQDIVTDSSNAAVENLVLSYTLKIESNKQSGVAESYNGAVKTLFLQDKRARSRMVSLMRVQSVFYTKGENGKITVVKESGKDSYKKNITKEQWRQMNQKYEAADSEFLEDSITVLNYNCKKAIIHLKDGKNIIAYYTSDLKNELFKEVEPAFANIPGVVLHYEYESREAKFIYTAKDISFAPTGSEVHKIP